MARANYERKSTQQYLDLWERLKEYIDLSQVQALDRINMDNELRMAFFKHEGKKRVSNPAPLELISTTRSDLMNVLMYDPDVAEKVRGDLVQKHVVVRQTKTGRTVYQIAGGTPSFVYGGKERRAGQFIKGNSFEKAVRNFDEMSK